MLKVSLIIFSALCIQVFGIDPIYKPIGLSLYFEVLADRFEDIVNDGQHFDFSRLKIRKINKTRSFVGEILIRSPIGDDITIEVKAFMKQGGEYRLMPYRLTPTPFCAFLIKDTYGYPDLAKNSDFPENIEDECPLQPKTYNIRGVVYRLDNVPKAAAHSGDYALEVSLRRNKTMLNKFRLYGTVIQI